MKTETNSSRGAARPQATEGSQDLPGEIAQLISQGKCKQAVELAKERHKRSATAETERQLVQAYVARIEQFHSKGMAQEAQTLLTLVQQRFPSQRNQVAEIEMVAAIAAGRLDELLRPLASDATPPQVAAQIESALARKFTDLPALASSEALPAGHPLREAAAAVWSAFTAVTSGPVTEAQIALPEVSHRSPLAAWKMLVRAIAAFYRRDDTACRRALDAVPADSAVLSLATMVRSLIDGRKPPAGIARVLYQRILLDDEPLRLALEKIESALGYIDSGELRAGIREALRQCSQTRPELLERLRQHTSVACAMRQVPVELVQSALGSTRKNANFWRLMARAGVGHEPEVMTALYWERFLRHAIAEGMFAETGAEAAAVWMRIAEVVAPLSLEELATDRHRAGSVGRISVYYLDQPAEIVRLRPVTDQQLADFVLQPGRGFERAAKIQPDTEIFTRWWAWAKQVDLPIKQAEDIALQWRQSLPRDVQPLVILSSLAEGRDALSLALKRLTEAEAIDPLNQQVRQARLRLTLSIAWRHFADRKSHLVEKDLADLAALPGMNEGDRAAVLESMRGAAFALAGDATGEAACYEKVLALAGPILGPVVFHSIKVMAKLEDVSDVVAPLAVEAPPLDIALVVARIVRMCSDLDLKIFRPQVWEQAITQVLRKSPCPLANADVIVLGKTLAHHSEMESVYQASTVGLARTNPPAISAQFLLLRARSLDQSWHMPRRIQCLRAAIELAKQAHDESLMREVFAVVDRNPSDRRTIGSARSGQGLSPQALGEILDKERQASAFPRTQDDIQAFLADAIAEDLKSASRFGSFGAADAGFDDEDFDDDDWGDDPDDDDDFEQAGLFDPPELTPKQRASLDESLQENGIDSPEQLLQNPKLMVEAMAKALGQNISDAELRVLIEQMRKLVAGSGIGPGGNSKKDRKRKR